MRPTDPLTVFAPAFDAADVEWMVAGGVAAVVYGVPHLTHGLDVVTAFAPSDAERVAARFPASDFYCPPVEVIADEAGRDAFGHFNVLHHGTDARADVYLAGRDVLARRGLDGRRHVDLVGHAVPIAPPDYVILHKLRFRQQGASERHLRDVRSMLRVLGDSVDRVALAREADHLGLAREWGEMEALRE